MIRFYDMFTARLRDSEFATAMEGPTMAKQEFKEECDINTIMAKYLKQAIVPGNVKVGAYGDFANAPDYRESLHIMMEAQAQFDALPAKVRDRFKNDPAAFLEWVAKPENLDEAHDLGLLNAEGVKRVTDARAAVKNKADAEALERARALIAKEEAERRKA